MPMGSRLLRGWSLCLALSGLPAFVCAQGQPLPTASSPASLSPLWHKLKPHEKQALAPLATRWAELTEAQRSKWLSIAQQFDQKPAAEQQTMQARMAEWVALSPAQRNQARLNFGNLQNLTRDEKKSRWDEYLALSEDEKRKLSARAAGVTRTTAPSTKPQPTDRLVQPALRSVPDAAQAQRRSINRKTLLPVAPPSEAAAHSPLPADESPAASEAAD